MWIILCFVGAAPSFYWAHGEYDWWGMIAGIATFAVAYAVLAGREGIRRRLRQPFVRRTVKIGYGARVAISIVFPIGLAADLYPGILSLVITE